MAVVFFLPFLVITASYCIVTYRIWRYSRRRSSSLRVGAHSATRSANAANIVCNANYDSGRSGHSIGDEQVGL